MAIESKIEWTDATFNPWMGCTKVSPACDHCYAEVSTPSRRFGIKWGAGQPRQRTSEANWRQPVLWNAREFAQCADCGWRGEWPATLEGSLGACPSCIEGALVLARRRVFCASLADVFDNEVDPQWRADLFALIAATPNLDWLLLTKRIGNVAKMLGEHKTTRLLPNVWLGISVVSQTEVERDVPKLLEAPANIRFLSMEPLLGPVNFSGLFANRHDARDGTNMLEMLDWVIVGGESGHNARKMHPEWVRSLRDQCKAAGTPFLFKQWGEWAPLVGEPTPEAIVMTNPGYRFATMHRPGKKAAGRVLDGVLHTEYPVQRA